MFRIKKITLNEKDEYSFYDDYTVVFGTNSTGKSVLFKIIYFMLGSTTGWQERSVWALDGMENVHTLTMEVDNGKSLFLMRTRNNDLFYKNSEQDNYLKIDIDVYKEMIQSMLISNTECFDFYKEVVGEKLNYRGLCYLNFIDQYALGNIIHVFSQSTDYKYAKRIRKQMYFLFDSAKQKALSQLESERDEINKTLENYQEVLSQRKMLEEQINLEMNYLEIDTPDLLSDKKACFREFCNNRTKKTDPLNKDYAYLLKVSNQLANQIQIEKTFSKQRDLIESRNKKCDLLLQLLKNSIGDNDEFGDYLASINSTLDFIEKENNILSLKDYKASIEMITSKKQRIDEQIQKIRNSMQEKSESDVVNSIKALDYYFNKYERLELGLDLSTLESKKKELDKRIKKLSGEINGSKSAELNKFLTDSYLKMPNELDFVKQDSKRLNFAVEFIPSKTETIGRETEIIKVDGEEKEKTVEFAPGSKARQTCWQIITYVGIQRFAKKMYNSLPILPILVVDGINEPFDNKFSTVFDSLRQICVDNGIQLICTTTNKVGENVIDLSKKGLNSARKKVTNV